MTYIGTQWNVTGSNAKVIIAGGDLHIREGKPDPEPEDEITVEVTVVSPTEQPAIEA